MKKLHIISRVIVGITFMFSGFVKGIDPLGTAYRLEDYFLAWGTDWMLPSALVLSILLSTMEFVLGFVILLNLKPKISAWLLLGVMIFFTGLTFYDAMENPVPDCGCFGDAIKLTNWQTFFKNVILLVPTLFIFSYRDRIRDQHGNKVSYGSAAIVTVMFVSMSIYCYMYLPIIDFMDWKVGNKMYIENAQPVQYFVTYKNKESGEVREYLSPDYPYNDSTWMAQWEFVSQRVVDPNASTGNDLQVIDMEGNDVTQDLIHNPGYQFLLISWDIEKANHEGLSRMQDFSQKAEANGNGFAAITSSVESRIDSTSKKLGLSFSFYQADDITLKMMIRSNPGLILLKDGVVMGKWSHHEFVDYGEFTSKKIHLK